MNSIALLDALAALGWLAVIVLLLVRWTNAQAVRVRWVFLGLAAFSFLYCLCMFAEWSGATLRLEGVEDLFGVTLPVWWIFAFYALSERLLSAELEANEADLRRGQEVARLGSWHLDPGAASLTCSSEMLRLFGRSADASLSRADMLNAVHAGDRGAVEKAWHAALTGAPFEVEYRIDVGGQTTWLQERAQFELDERGKLSHALGTVQDVSERVIAEQERTKLKEELHQAQKMEAMGQLAGGVAHDFNNLLTVILGNVDNLRDLLPDNTYNQNALQDIENAANQATGVTRALLTFSHQLPAERQVIDLVDVVQVTAKLLRRLLLASIELNVSAPRGRPVLVCADSTQLQQVILNLAVNARDAMPDGGRLTIALSTLEVQGADSTGPVSRAVITVADTGTGVAPEVQARMFEPFFTTKERGQGTGLGLAIIHSIVDELGGDIRVDSVVGQGTTFEILLPLADGPAHATAGAEDVSAPQGNGELLLVADNNTQAKELVVRCLRGRGYAVQPFENGAELLAAFAENPDRADMVVTDLDLPGRSGLEIIDAIRSRGSRVPIVLVTGSVMTKLDEHLVGNTTLLRKPYRLDELSRAVAEAFERFREEEAAS